MRTISHLAVRPGTRFDESDPAQDGNKNTKFADLIIDGHSLYQKLKKHDLIPCLGWGSEDYQRQMIGYFLLRQPHEYMFYRYPVLVCPWCADEECGYISVKIDREDDIVTWKDFRLGANNEPIHIGPFYFDWNNYKSAIEATFGTAGIQ